MFISMSEDKKQARAIKKHVDAIHLPIAEEEKQETDNRTFEEIVEEGAKYNPDDLPDMGALEALFQTL